MQKIDPQSSALLLIEFQNEWLHPQGKLYPLMQDTLQFQDSIQQAKMALAAARKGNMSIIHSGLRFSADYREIKPAQHGLRHEIPIHQTFLASGPGCLFTPPFEPQAEEFIVEGRKGSSAFVGSNLHAHLQSQQIETLYIMGYALHVCVESTIRMAHDLGYETVLIQDASAAFTQAQKDYVLKDVMPHFGEAITTQQFTTSQRI